MQEIINLKDVSILAITVFTLIDMFVTFVYITRYKEWQPTKEYKYIERNPILVFLFNSLGLSRGIFVGTLIILTLNILIASFTHWGVALLLIGLQLFAILNHKRNLGILDKLVKKYPSGKLPKSMLLPEEKKRRDK